MIVIIILLTIIAINSSINIYEYIKEIKKKKYDDLRKEILNASDGNLDNIDVEFWRSKC